MSIRHAVLILSLALMTVPGMSCGNDPTGPSDSGSSEIHIVVIRGPNGAFSFDPVNEVVRVGQKVAWRNEDSTTHALVDDNGLLDTGDIRPGATSRSVALSKSAAVEYHCSDNPSMHGLLSVNP